MIRKPISTRARFFIGGLSVVLLICSYAWLSHKQHVFNPKDTTIPNAQQLVEGVVQITTLNELGEMWLWEDVKATYCRLLGGIVVGVLLAFFIGMAMGVWQPAEAFFFPPLSFFAKIPPTAMMAVYFVLFGTEYTMYLAMIALGIFPTLAQSVHSAAKTDVPETLIHKAYTLGADHFEVISNIVYKQILPRVIESVRLQIGPALVFLIAAELLVADVGFGYRLRIQSRLLNMNVVYLYLVFLGVTGYGLDFALKYTQAKLCPWFEGRR